MSLKKGVGIQNCSFSTSDKDLQSIGTLHSPPCDAIKNPLTTLSLFNDDDHDNNICSATSCDGKDQQPTEVSQKMPPINLLYKKHGLVS